LLTISVSNVYVQITLALLLREKHDDSHIVKTRLFFTTLTDCTSHRVDNTSYIKIHPDYSHLK